MHALKKTLRDHLESNDLDAVAALAKDHPRVLSLLVRLSYDKDTLVGRRAITAMGRVASELVETQYNALRELTRKLLWSLNDESGGIGWSAPELLGEIVAADPKRFSDLIPIIASVYEIEEDVFRPGVLYALSRIADADPARVSALSDTIIIALADKDPLTRVHAIETAIKIAPFLDDEKRGRLESAFERLRRDRAEAWIYREKDFENVTVGDMAKIAMNGLLQKP